MAVTAKVDFEKKVTAAINAQSLKGKKVCDVEVGYVAYYAIYVHEDLSMNHPNGGEAKYLEKPLRLLEPELKKMIVNKMKQKKGLAFALMAAGTKLLTESQKLVPVRTGFLRDSGYVKLISG